MVLCILTVLFLSGRRLDGWIECGKVMRTDDGKQRSLQFASHSLSFVVLGEWAGCGFQSFNGTPPIKQP